jgi:acyl carrier protein
MTKIVEENTVNTSNVQITESNISDWLVSYLADLLETSPDQIDVKTTFARYGLDSSAAVVLTGDLGGWLGQELEPTILYDYPTIAELSAHLVQAS